MKTRRNLEASKIQRADKAAAIGRLMLGEVKHMREFLDVGKRDYGSLPRRALRSGVSDIQERLSSELEKFCGHNFEGMTAAKLADLYDVSALHIEQIGIYVIPLPEFQKCFARVRSNALADAPQYATVVLTLQGLKYRFPEQQLTGDVIATLDLFKRFRHASVFTSEQADYIARSIRFAARSCVAAAFNLLEAVLNGLLWQLVQSGVKNSVNITAKQREMLEEPTKASLRGKLMNLPVLLTGFPLINLSATERVLDSAKRYRDSLTHPSPFTAPASHGGYDKLEYFYSINEPIAKKILGDVISVLEALFNHLKAQRPKWFAILRQEFESPEPSDLETMHGSEIWRDLGDLDTHY
jgi:hypothetical protein